MFSRTRRLAVALVALIMGSAPFAAAAAGEPTIPENPGQLVTMETLPAQLWLPGTSAAYRITYTSTDYAGDPNVVVGAVFVPQGQAPARGWPILSWAHGTIGVADVCDQTVVGRSQRDIDYLSRWLREGYAIVASEYEGLGIPGPHPYLNGTSEAHGVIDVVRAAQRVDLSLSRTWIAVGQSQGGQAALFTGAMQARYAPELDFRGAIATAPPTQWRTTIGVAQPFDPAKPANPFALLALEGMRATHADFGVGTYLTPAGRELLGEAQRTMCYKQLAERLDGHTAGEVYDVDAAEQERFTKLLEQDADIPIVAHEQGVFIAQGLADTVVYPPASKTTAYQLDVAGTDVTFRAYPDADHSGVMAAAFPDLLAWADDRIVNK